MELAPHDRQFHRVLNGVLKDMEGFFARCVAAGQKDGSIPAELNAADMAKTLLASLMGLRVLARVNPKRELLEGAARPVLALIGVPTHARRKN
jgi:TetR/AcrR family transcriptional regulator, transcriptional repressor for nem operon